MVKESVSSDKSCSLQELAGVILVCLAFLIANWFLGHIAVVGPDEPGYSDPAASLLFGQGFTSGAWYGQTSSEFWAGNVPLHAFLLYVWYQVFGFSHLAIRILSAIYVCLGVLLVWRASLKMGLIQSFQWRVFLVLALLMVESSYYVCQFGRPDGITFLLAGLTIWSFTLGSVPGRMLALGVVGFLAPWAGLQFAVALICVMMGVLITFRFKMWREAAVVVFGVGLGIGGLLFFYYQNGVLEAFIGSILPHTATATRSVYSYNGFFQDRSFVPLVLAALAVGFYTLRYKKEDGFLRWTAIWALGAFVALPLVLFVAGKFSTGYTWMPAILGIPVILAWIERAALSSGGFLWLVRVLIAAAVVAGYPRVVAKAIMEPTNWNDARTLSDMAPMIKPSDWVIYSAPAFYPAKAGAAKAFYLNWYLRPITDEEKSKVSLLLIEPWRLPDVITVIGGAWVPVGTAFDIPIKKMFRPDDLLHVQAYRRAP